MNKQEQFESRVLEVAEWLEQGNKEPEAVAAFATKWSCANRTVERAVAMAKDLLADKLPDRNRLINAIRSEVLADDFESDLLSNLEIEAALCRFALNPVAAPKEKIRALNMLLKIRGRYEKPEKKETGVKETTPDNYRD